MPQSTGLVDVEQDPFFMEDLLQMSRAHNYRRWQLEIVAPYVTGNVLEVGGGIGNFTPELARLGASVISMEPNAYCYARLLETTRGLSNVRVVHSTVEGYDRQSPKPGPLDTVILMNVLEHLQEDVAILETLQRELKPGGRFVILVPAGPWAFGSTDQRLGHFRRYSKTSARALAARLRLEVEKLRYYNFIGIWAWWWNGRITRRQSQNDAQIRLFDRYLVPFLSRVERLLPPPLGQSLLLVARKAAA
jgi:SAM-dependent methyltransferase